MSAANGFSRDVAGNWEPARRLRLQMHALPES